MRRLGLLLLTAFIGCHTALNRQCTFLAWHQGELQDTSWLSTLLADDQFIPPDRLCFGEHGFKRKPILPAGWEWDNPLARRIYHPRARYCIRKVHPNGSGQQAAYDVCGRLITDGFSAGTPDKVSHRVSFLGHRREDVKPYRLACKLDRLCGGEAFRRLYFQVRPPTPGK